MLAELHEAPKEKTGAVLRILEKTVADLPNTLSPSLPHKDLAEATKNYKLMFRYTPSAKYLEGGLTQQVVYERIASSVHEHTRWMEQQPSLQLKTSVAYCIAAFERCTFRCLLRGSPGLFSFPELQVLVRIQPIFACNVCGDTDVPEKDRIFCRKCETFMCCPKCKDGTHPVFSWLLLVADTGVDGVLQVFATSAAGARRVCRQLLGVLPVPEDGHWPLQEMRPMQDGALLLQRVPGGRLEGRSQDRMPTAYRFSNSVWPLNVISRTQKASCSSTRLFCGSSMNKTKK